MPYNSLIGRPTEDQLSELSLLAHLLGNYAISLQEGEELLPGQQRRLEEIAAGCALTGTQHGC